MAFIRRVENFVCENCNTEVEGNGYTDHCPNCLYSKHVDINPGDRLCDCKGLMKPISVEYKKQKYRIHYVCTKCGYKHIVDANKNDSFDALLSLQNS
ncbi:RNHCP domain-containing protein [bacterium]|nr:RNHCP domain-containing protein [bacterium]